MGERITAGGGVGIVRFPVCWPFLFVILPLGSTVRSPYILSRCLSLLRLLGIQAGLLYVLGLALFNCLGCMSWTMGRGERASFCIRDGWSRFAQCRQKFEMATPTPAVIVCVMTSGRTIANISINLSLLGISRSGNTKPGVSQINTTCERAALQLCPSIHHHWLVKCQ